MSVIIEKIDQNENARPDRCRFDMYVVVKDEVPFSFDFGKKGKKKDCTIRPDKYYPDKIEKWLPHLIKNVNRFRKEYKSVELYDNSKPKNSTERIILKIYRGKPLINLLPDYGDLLKDFPLPEYLSYEIKPD